MPILRDDLDRRIISLALPALGTLAIEPLYVLVDTAIVGRLGTAPLAGLGIAATVLLTVTALASFLEYGVTPAVAFAHGRGRPDEAHTAAGDALWLAALLGLPVAGLLALVAPQLSAALGGHGEVGHDAIIYLRISAIGLPFVLVVLAGHGVMRGVNDLRRPLVIVAVANAANVVLEIVAVYVLNLGIAGSAWSTVIVQIGAALAFSGVLAPHVAWHRPQWERLGPMLITGWHLAVRVAAMLAVWITATAVAARIDTPTLAAHQVLTQVFMFLALALDALAIPSQSLVAGALGAGDPDAAMNLARRSTELSLWCGGVIGVVLVAASPVLPYVFTNDGRVVSRLIGGLVVLAVMQIPGAMAFALDGVLIGGQDERFLGRAAVVNLVAFAPLVLATLLVPRLGILGLWGAQLTWMTMRAIVNGWRFRSRRWIRDPLLGE